MDAAIELPQPDRQAGWPAELSIPLAHVLVPECVRKAVLKAEPAGRLYRVMTSSNVEWWLMDRHDELIDIFWQSMTSSIMKSALRLKAKVSSASKTSDSAAGCSCRKAASGQAVEWSCRGRHIMLGMAKAKTVYTCTECGGQSPKWQGQCPHCTAWNTLVETVAETPSVNRYAALAQTGGLQKLSEVEAAEVPRHSSGIVEFDRVLGGGLVPGGVVLIGGDPGIGKSTLLLQALCHIGGQQRVIYVSGEESPQQIAMRARRLGLDAGPVELLAEINLEKILATLQAHKPDVAVIDSIQTLYSEALQSAPGSVAQVRECSAQLTRLAKQLGITVVLVGHVTKEGTLAGPRVLEHIVDTVLYFEGDPNSSFRLIRAFKNRFGAVNELGVFAMTEKGLREVSNPSALFLSHHVEQVAGSCITVTQEGTRPLLVEVQALVDDAHAANPKRLCVGLEQNRLAMLLAVLHRHAGVACFDQDVFVNAVGGVKIAEPAADLAVLMAIVSSLKNNAMDGKIIVFGEVGLAGEVRPVQRGQERLKEAAKLGFTRAVVPKANQPKQRVPGIEVVAVERVEQAIAALRNS